MISMKTALTRITTDHSEIRKWVKERKGHPIQQLPIIGNAQAIYFDDKEKLIVGESDPRGEGKAIGY